MKKLMTGIVLSTMMTSTVVVAEVQNVDIKQLREDVDALQAKDKQMEDHSMSAFQLAGYASLDYIDEENEDGSFSELKFAPLLLYTYGDIFLFEAEVEFEINDEGESETELEYAAGTFFINDYMGLQVGKFLSPIGQFVQTQHPSWINKLPSAPVGFGHDGAAPSSNIGIALRGGLPKMGGIRSNYTIFVANAPTFGVADDGDVIIDTEAKTDVGDATMTIGGRYAINPLGNMEIGVSLATGEVEEELPSEETITRDYDVFGTDLMYNIDALNLKAEYIQQKIGENALSTLEGGTWKAWYAQAAYQFSSVKLEPVVRYSDYDNPETNRNQWAVGLNYLFANNLIAKVAYEFNEDEDDTAIDSHANNDRFLVQFAIGF
ncbi:hypothetical protein TSL6_03650 [Sulfurovum sp. TSL6]|uniref:porin n=1 Tax=Sulfurovum sp. TSL6 TaxID=2826995 RepID=UPI001CC3432F|nr:porin [Sulfurovum sp. TSL6]GIT99858.1 hypothetical protein TSL6_03650 [Sulfurovum sp. TSL6]